MPEQCSGHADPLRAFPKDKPLRLDLNVHCDEDRAIQLGAPPARNAKYRRARNIILVQITIAALGNPNQWLHYSRDRNYYASTRRYHRGRLSYETVIAAVEHLESARIIIHDRARPGPNSTFRSRLRLNPQLRNFLPFWDTSMLEYRDSEPIRLKDGDKRLIDYKDTRETRHMRRDVLEQNDALSSITINLVHPFWSIDRHGLLRRDDVVVNPMRNHLYRVFNDRWNRGGRFYGGWWQGVPSDDRGHLLIDGQPVVERDYEYIHPTLMRAITGVGWSGADPYEIEDIDRSLAKRTFNTLLNLRENQSARKAVAYELQKRGHPDPYKLADDLIEAVKNRHPQYERFWQSGSGIILQRIDSDICKDVQAQMRTKGEVVLSIHDGFIVREKARHLLEEAMDDARGKKLCELRKKGHNILQ